MSTTDDMLVEAIMTVLNREENWSRDPDSDGWVYNIQASARALIAAGYRKVEAAPSDTDREAIEAVERAAQFDLSQGLYSVTPHLQNAMHVLLSRTPQPVQVEVTAEQVQVFYYEHDCEWLSKYCDEHHKRSAWVSEDALGGGDPVSTTDEARAEAVEALDRLTQIALDNTSEDVHEEVYEDAKRIRAEWQASRKVEAPEGDREIFPGTLAALNDLAADELIAWFASRTSQPVQVEVTDNRKLIDRAREMRMDAEVGTHVERMRILGELANALQASDAALSAALGGGDHAE